MAEPATLAPTPPAMSELRLTARGAWPDGLIDLSRSEPLPVPLPDACAERVQGELMRARLYSPPGGLAPARAAVAHYASAATGLEIGPDRVAMTAGAMQGITISLRALAEPGDEVLVPVPYFHAHPRQVEHAGATPRFVDTRPRQGVLTPEAVERAVGPRTRALLLCNPSNPGGVALGRAQLAEILAALPADVAVIGDEVYAEYVYEGRFASLLEVVAEEDAGRELVVVGTASKTATMPGWRVGSAIGTPGLAPRLAAAAATLSGAPSTPAQLAYAAWLADPPALDRMAPYRPRLRDALDALAAAGLDVRPPGATYYVWATARGAGGDRAEDDAASGSAGAAPIGSADAVLAAARATGALVWPGALFGDRESVRISLSVPRRELREGLTRLTDPWREVRGSDVPIP